MDADEYPPFPFPGPARAAAPTTSPPLRPQQPIAVDPAAEAATAERRRQEFRLYQMRPRLPVMRGEVVLPPPFPFPGDTVSTEVDAPITRRAAQAAGVPESYLQALIAHESGGDANAANPQSTAVGHAQFTEAPWLSYIASRGPRYGFRDDMAPEQNQKDVLALRADPMWSALMAGEMARDNAQLLRSVLRRNVSQGEVYLAHFAGPMPAAAMIRAAEDDARRGGRGRPATAFVSAAAAESNRQIFFDENGVPRSVSNVVGRQTRAFRGVFEVNPHGVATPGEAAEAMANTAQRLGAAVMGFY